MRRRKRAEALGYNYPPLPRKKAAMDEPERLPCPTCGEPATLQARMCPHCGANLLVDVNLGTPVTDGRVRYKIARGLQALGPGAPSLSEIQAALVAPRPAAARGVTRHFARSAIVLLTDLGLKASLDRAETKVSTTSDGTRGWLGISGKALAALILVAMAVTAWQQLLEKPRPSPEPTRPGAAARRVSGGAPAPPLSSRDLAQRSLPSTVSLRCSNSVGSGFFVAPDLVLTNHHVLCPKEGGLQVVMSDGRKLVGLVVSSDPGVDLGLVRAVGAKAIPLPLGDIAEVAVGDKVMIIGSPIGLEFTVHEGNVSSLQRSAFGVAYMQLDAKINPGNSGGPVIDTQGRVVGVVSLKARGAEGIGLALPINYAYRSEMRLVNPPSPAAGSSATFTLMAAHAKEESGSETRAARMQPGEGMGGDEKPLLIGGFFDQYRRMVVRLARVADRAPGFEEITVKVWSHSEVLCTLKGDVSSWKAVDPAAAGSGFTAKSAAVLKEFAQERDIYLGESPLRFDLCPQARSRRDIEVELEGASPFANRLGLE